MTAGKVYLQSHVGVTKPETLDSLFKAIQWLLKKKANLIIIEDRDREGKFILCREIENKEDKKLYQTKEFEDDMTIKINWDGSGSVRIAVNNFNEEKTQKLKKWFKKTMEVIEVRYEIL